MTKRDIGWHFPSNEGGQIDGFNHPGIAHFMGAPFSSLAREVIQNSLDAQACKNEPVSVSFEILELNRDDIGGDELLDIFERCKSIAEEADDSRAKPVLQDGITMLSGDTIPCLRVSDRNTTGLRGEQWKALVKMQGVNLKPGLIGGGGSHGIGKYAPFAVSILRTVFYWTCYDYAESNIENFQGKSVLMSHENVLGKQTQGTGFFGIKDQCRELNSKIPASFRVLSNHNGSPVRGTSLLVAGFRAEATWRLRIASSVIENFFCALAAGTLSVILEPDQDQEDEDLLEINKNTLGKWFEHLFASADTGSQEDNDRSALKEAKEFWHLLNDNSDSVHIVDKQDRDLGHCELRIRLGDGLPSRVGLIRRTGMLVTTRQKGLLRFPGFRDFVAICQFLDPEGNELLRRMENPSHDKFEPNRLPTQEDQRRGQRALKRITGWIRDSIRGMAIPTDGEKTDVLSELAVLLPQTYPEDEFDHRKPDEDGDTEPGFAERVRITLKPVRSHSLARNPGSEEEADGPGNDLGSGREHGGKGGRRTNGKGGGGGKTRRHIDLSNIRILPVSDNKNQHILSFQASETGIVKIHIEEAGDVSTLPRDDIRATAEEVSLDHIELVRGQEHRIKISADLPLGDRAMRVSASAVQEQES